MNCRRNCFLVILILGIFCFLVGCNSKRVNNASHSGIREENPESKSAESTDAAEQTTVDASNLHESPNAAVGPLAIREWIKETVENLPSSIPDNSYSDFPGANVALFAPDELDIGKRFHGFENKELKTKIVVTRSPVSFRKSTRPFLTRLVGEAVKKYYAHYFTPKEVSGLDGAYLFFVKPVQNVPVAFHYLAFGDDSRSWIVSGSHPLKSLDDNASQIVESILSTKLLPNTEPDQVDVEFQLSSSKLKMTHGWTKTIAFTKDGTFPFDDPNFPFFRAQPSVTELRVPKDKRAKFARSRYTPSPDIKVERIYKEQDILVDGLPGREIFGFAYDRSTNTNLFLYCAVLFEEDTQVIMHGWAGQSHEDMEQEFMNIVRSFVRN